MRKKTTIFRSLFLASFILLMGAVEPDELPVHPVGEESFEIRWVTQFPPEKRSENRGFREVATDLLLGRSPELSSKPFAIVANDPDDFIVLDQGLRSMIRHSDGKSEILRPFRMDDANFPSLVGLCGFTGKEMLFTDSKLNKVFRTDGRELHTLQELKQPTGIAYLEVKQQIWVVETGAHSISILNLKGDLVKRIGKRGTDPGEFNFPTFIWNDSTGKIYIVDSMNFRVQVFDIEGNYLFSFGQAGDATGYFARPKGIATDSHGHIYVADALFHVVQVFDPEGNLLYYFGGQGQNRGEFWLPTGLYIDRDDLIYVADSYNSRVQVFELLKK